LQDSDFAPGGIYPDLRRTGSAAVITGGDVNPVFLIDGRTLRLGCYSRKRYKCVGVMNIKGITGFNRHKKINIRIL